MATVDKLNRVLQTKSDIKSAIEDKGVSVGNVPFKDYPAKIAEIEGGGEPTPFDGWVMAKDSDFNVDNKYVGTNTKIILPKKIRGVPLTDALSMFNGTTIGDLSVISGGNNITSAQSMFYNARAKYIDLSNFNTSRITSMYAMFYNTPNLTQLDLSNFDTSNVTDMRFMFHRASGLTSLDLSNFDTSNVTDMYAMFAAPTTGLSGLTSLDLSNFDTSNVTNMGSMFNTMRGLRSLDLSNFDTSNVRDMSYMFNQASGLRSLDLSNFDTSNVTNMRSMFGAMSGLTSLDLSNFDTSNVTDMTEMFFNYRLAVLDLSSFDTSAVTRSANMFYAARATVGYARTQADADFFNRTTGKPAGLTFVVKPVEE